MYTTGLQNLLRVEQFDIFGIFMKVKTKKAAAKRYRVMGSGRVKAGQAGKRHNTGKKRSKRTRNLRKIVTVNDSDIVNVRRVLPYARDVR